MVYDMKTEIIEGYLILSTILELISEPIISIGIISLKSYINTTFSSFSLFD